MSGVGSPGKPGEHPLPPTGPAVSKTVEIEMQVRVPPMFPWWFGSHARPQKFGKPPSAAKLPGTQTTLDPCKGLQQGPPGWGEAPAEGLGEGLSCSFSLSPRTRGRRVKLSLAPRVPGVPQLLCQSGPRLSCLCQQQI